MASRRQASRTRLVRQWRMRQRRMRQRRQWARAERRREHINTNRSARAPLPARRPRSGAGVGGEAALIRGPESPRVSDLFLQWPITLSAVLSCYLVSFEQLPRAGMRISNRDAIRRGPHGHACVGRERRTAILMTRYYCKHFKAAPLRRRRRCGCLVESRVSARGPRRSPESGERERYRERSASGARSSGIVVCAARPLRRSHCAGARCRSRHQTAQTEG